MSKQVEKIFEKIEEIDKVEEGDHFALLEEYVEGHIDKLPEEMLIYLKQLELIRGFFYSGNTSPNRIIRKLQVHYPDLSVKQCRTRINDARVHFYLDEELKKEFYKKIHYEQQMQLYQVTKMTAKTASENEIASKILERAGKLIDLDKADKEKLPEEFFLKPRRFFTLNPADIGLPENMDRNKVGRWLDKLHIAEAEKLRLKEDGGMAPKTMFDTDGETDDLEG